MNGLSLATALMIAFETSKVDLSGKALEPISRSRDSLDQPKLLKPLQAPLNGFEGVIERVGRA